MDPHILSVFGVKCSLLERPQFQGEPRTKLLDTHLLCIPEDVPVEGEGGRKERGGGEERGVMVPGDHLYPSREVRRAGRK